VARLYADENFPFPVVIALRVLGHEVKTSLEAGHANKAMTDEQVLVAATTDNRAILTINRKHFIRLHNAGSSHEGIIACTFDPDFTAQAKRIHTAISLEPILKGKMLRVNRPA
jgi:Domain of unknown function (DUF5615)